MTRVAPARSARPCLPRLGPWKVRTGPPPTSCSPGALAAASLAHWPRMELGRTARVPPCGRPPAMPRRAGDDQAPGGARGAVATSASSSTVLPRPCSSARMPPQGGRAPGSSRLVIQARATRWWGMSETDRAPGGGSAPVEEDAVAPPARPSRAAFRAAAASPGARWEAAAAAAAPTAATDSALARRLEGRRRGGGGGIAAPGGRGTAAVLPSKGGGRGK